MDNYKKKLSEYEDELKNKYAKFDYDAEADALFKMKRAQLERDQRDGVSEVLAQYAANTGMGGSSAAMTAAQQTASKYNARAADALADSEQKAYSRWAGERAALEDKIADTKAAALSEADTRLALGDTSGYRALGYDTSAYEAQLAAEQAERQRAAGIADAEARASLGDLSGYRALGYDTSAYEAKLAAEKAAAGEEIGVNGITKSQYDSIMDRYMKMYTATDDDDVRAELTAKMESAYNEYYGYYTPEEIESTPVLTDVQANDYVNQIIAWDGIAPADIYKQLVAYYYRKPLITEDGQVFRGQAALSAMGITMQVETNKDIVVEDTAKPSSSTVNPDRRASAARRAAEKENDKKTNQSTGLTINNKPYRGWLV